MRAVSPNLLLLLASCCVWHRCYAVHMAVTDLRIYGGDPVKITEVPFMAQFNENGFQNCGAAIIHEQFVLTAGHCILNYTKQNVIVGSDKVTGGDIYKVEKIFRHPKYYWNDTDIQYDIAVIKLKKKLTFNERVQLIKIADSSFVPNPGEMMETVGYGQTEHEHTSHQLLKVDLPYVDRDTCQRDYDKIDYAKVTDHMICAGGVAGKSACFGDSGGPLFYKGLLMGLTSWGNGNPCGQKNFPTVFTYVPSFKDFVDEVIKNNTLY